ncbi:TrbC/VirB2 family protein [Ruminococcus sp. 210702-SL.1.03]|jgi:hypothetical protein|uniref:TrbC/VirB2 family protein n=1 Tax=Ruminococcus sp. 210702-SL.1.03 TaxID=2883233 RepID=UPI001D07528D|nr:TrbC/VirB2 family protein [Ruminococcus sp. 210702-SL.1.03]MCB6616924.1 TrbC/VirB2 family protein [Ruminococcus sp. 210702-SL.1.03]
MKNKKTFASLLIALMMGCIMMFGMGVVASAEQEQQSVRDSAPQVQYYIDTSGIENLITDIQGSMTKIGLGIAGIAVLALGIVFITAGSQGMQKGKSMAISICVGVIVIGVGISIVGAIAEAAGA